MAIYLKKFENHTQYENYINGSDAILPNVSICTTEGDVHYNPYAEPVETRVIAKFNVTDTSSNTQIIGNNGLSQFSSVEIDGVEQQNVVSAYTFSTTGEHVVKYTLTNQTNLGTMAFWKCYSITSVEIPDSVTTIGQSAFNSCSSLTGITIPDNVTNIGDSAFRDCRSLTSIDIPSGVTSIGNYVFYGCRSLTSINIPSGVISIGSSSFEACTGFTSVTIPDSVTTIGNSAFTNCVNIKTCLIGNGVTSIGDYAFNNCTGLTNINIPSSVTNVGKRVFTGCNKLPVVGDVMYADTYAVKYVNNSASQSTVTIRNGTRFLGSVFYNSKVPGVFLPDSVISLDDDTFQYCSSLIYIVCYAMTRPKAYTTTFLGVKTNGTLYVPQGSTGYDVWMGTGNYYLGKYNWTKVEQ